MAKREKLDELEQGLEQEDGRTLDIDQELQDFLIEHADLEKGYHVKVYRVSQLPGDRPDYRYLRSYEKQIPTEDQIAAQFGAGPYRLYLQYSDRSGKRHGKTRLLTVDESWAGAASPAAALPVGAPVASPGFGPEHMLALFTSSLNAVVAVAKGGGRGNGGGDPTDTFKSLMESFGTMHIDGMRRAQEVALGTSEDDEPEGAGEMVLGLLMKGWEMFGKGLFSAPKSFMGQAAAQLQGRPEMQYLLEHPEEYVELFESFAQQTGVERARLDKFVKGLGFPTADELMEKAAQAAAAAEGAGK